MLGRKLQGTRSICFYRISRPVTCFSELDGFPLSFLPFGLLQDLFYSSSSLASLLEIQKLLIPNPWVTDIRCRFNNSRIARKNHNSVHPVHTFSKHFPET